MIVLTYGAVLLAAYLLGALPIGYLAAKMIRRVDITTIGSGHTGGTNVFRSAGPVAGGITIVLDLAKGYAAAALAKMLVPDAPALIAVAGTMAVLGHNYSIFLGFRGGVGTMTTLGVTLALMPLSAGVAVLFGILIIVISRYSSLGSLTVAVMLPLACLAGALLGWWSYAYLIFAVGSSILGVYELRSNIDRLRRGTERRLGQFIQPGKVDVLPRKS